MKDQLGNLGLRSEGDNLELLKFQGAIKETKTHKAWTNKSSPPKVE